MIKRHPLIAFFVLAYAVAWAFVPFGSFGAFGPLVAALLVVPLTQGRPGLRELGSRLVRWRVRWFWYVVALGLPLGVHFVTAGLNIAMGDPVPAVTFGSVSAVVLAFLLRMVNPADGPLGEEPGWRGFALPGLQSRYSPLLATTILAVLVAGWHLPLFFLEEGGLQPPILVGGLVSTIAVTYWYTWLFNRTGGSVLLVLMAHSIEGSLQAQGWTYMAVWCVAAVGLIVCNLQAWRRPPRAPTAPSNSHRSVTRPRLGHARALIILLGAVYLVASPMSLGRAAANPAPDLASIDAYLEMEMREVRIPGLALGIVHNDEVVHLRGFGEAGPDGRAVTPQTPFILASASKSFTALAIMQLVESGKVDLDAPVRRYLPDFRVADEAASAQITVRHLLHHTSGLPEDSAFGPMLSNDISDQALSDRVRALERRAARPWRRRRVRVHRRQLRRARA